MPSRRHNQRRTRRVPRPLITSTIQQDTQFVQTTIAVTNSVFNYSIATLFPLTGSIGAGLDIEFHKFSVLVYPTGQTQTALGIIQQLAVQLALVDPVSSNMVPMTRAIPLSITTPTRLSMTVPKHLRRWYTSGSTVPLAAVLMSNANGASSIVLYATIETTATGAMAASIVV